MPSFRDVKKILSIKYQIKQKKLSMISPMKSKSATISEKKIDINLFEKI